MTTRREYADSPRGRSLAYDAAYRGDAEAEATYEEESDDLDERETCSRCHGRTHIPIRLDDWEVDDEPRWGETTCPRCGGTGYERDPEEYAELRYFYGPNWEEV